MEDTNRADLATLTNIVAARGDWTTAPSTKMLAARCICCSHILRDAVSAETGVGPDCRKMHGYESAATPANWIDAVALMFEALTLNDAWHPAVAAFLRGQAGLTSTGGAPDSPEQRARTAANALIHHAAANQGAVGLERIVAAIGALGFSQIARRIVANLNGVTVTEVEVDGKTLYNIEAPYNEAFTAALRRIPGRYFDRDAKANRAPVSARREVFAAILASHPAGTLVAGPRGVMVLRTAN